VSIKPPVVVVTRAQAQADELVGALEACGAEVRVMPVIQIVDAADAGAALRRFVAEVDAYDWVVVTSPNTVARLGGLGFKAGDSVRIAAIGPGTAEALRRIGVNAHLVADPHVAEGVLDMFPEGHGRIALPRAAVARDVLPQGLRDKGYMVDVIEAYQTTVVSHEPQQIVDFLEGADIVTFTASSTVRAFVGQVPATLIPPGIACIGPVTAQTAIELGLTPTVVASAHTIEGLVAAMFP